MNGWNSPSTAEKEMFAFACCISEEESQVGNDMHVEHGQVYEREDVASTSVKSVRTLNSEFRILKRRPHHGPCNP